jgi:hypothetical protein
VAGGRVASVHARRHMRCKNSPATAKGRAAQTARSTGGDVNTQESQQAIKAVMVAGRFKGTATLDGTSAAARRVRRRGPLGTY